MNVNIVQICDEEMRTHGMCVVLPFVYLRGLQAPLPDTLKETSVSVPNLTENCVPESGVPSDRSVFNLAANPEPSAAALLETFAAVARRRASESHLYQCNQQP